MLTIAGCFDLRSKGIADLETRAVPITLTFNTFSQISSLSCSTVVSEPIPALLIKISNCLLCLENSVNASVTDWPSPMSHLIKVATGAISPSAISKPKTVAPRAFKPLATSRPIPEPAPVMIAVNPLNSSLITFIYYCVYDAAKHPASQFYCCVTHRRP